ncbi:MAG: cytochrome C oxidase subunit II [Candidatus Cohnella colombiensis]|uniref:Cytochrome C oxidase subunit II n=1 Tax=Candidatus Cohnella colombiensis TaxID=3121368 RepID=A0AA95EYQ0_9BACL|nr:MAG: cytochrome C oxidase subunit II [Cohnella sp.]
MLKKGLYIIVATALILTIAACGSNKEGAPSASSGSTESLKPEMEVLIKASSWEFDQESYEIPKDTPVKLSLENINGMHGVKIDGTDIKLRGDQSTVVQLAAGTYNFECNIPCGAGHTKMKATLIVK